MEIIKVWLSPLIPVTLYDLLFQWPFTISYSNDPIQSLIIRSFGKLIEGKLDKLTEFAIKTATNLHTEPTELNSKSRFSLKANSKLMNVVAEVSDSLDNFNQNIEDIKDIASKASPK